MIRENGNCFELSTKDTTYVFRVLSNGLLEHVYYGERIELLGEEELAKGQVEAVAEKQAFAPGNSLVYAKEEQSFAPEYGGLECSAPGKGDVREPMAEVVGRSGARTLDFVYDSHEISVGKKAFETLPGSVDEADQVQQLKVVFHYERIGF